MSSAVQRSESVDNVCPVCHDVIEIFAIGPCDHPVCSRCSTRMRVLCEQLDCPICRSQMPQVAFVNKKSLFKDISLRDCIPNRKYKIFFEDKDVEDSFLDLLEFRCKMQSCQNRAPDRSFAQLQTHMRREHELFACDLCVSNLKIFPFERKFYNRKYLAIHRRVGDEDDKSYKGHPLCEFCDTRYNDKDDLLRHLRKDHFFCHFCDQHGSNAYYDQYNDLMKHFSESHFLCTDGDCGNPTTRFTHAFASEIDLKAHRASAHNKNLSKAQSREARTIEVDFQTARRRPGANRDDFDERQSAGGRPRGDRYNNRRRGHDPEDADLYRAIEASKETNRPDAQPAAEERVPDPVADFPALNGAVAPVSVPSVARPTREPEEDFPSLSTTRDNKQQTQLQTKAYSTIMNRQVDTKPAAPVVKESKPVLLGSVPRIREYKKSVPKNTEAEYPSLGGNSSTHKSISSVPKKSGDEYSSSSVSLSSNKPASLGSLSKISREYSSSVPKNSEDDYPSLGGSSSSAKPASLGSVAKITREYPSSVPKNSEDDYPSLGGSSSSAKPASLGSVAKISREYPSSVPKNSEDEYPALGSSSYLHKPALIGPTVKISREYPAFVPKNSEEEYPSLGGSTSAHSISGAPQAGPISWVKKSQTGSAVISSGPSSDSKMLKNDKYKSKQNIDGPVKDDRQFPKLFVGGVHKSNGMFGQNSPDWIKQSSGGGKKKPKSDKHYDESFELPESYQGSNEEPCNEGNVHLIKPAAAGVTATEKHIRKSAPANNPEEFPGLPVRASKAKSKEEGQKKKKVKKEGNVKANPSQDTNACLGDIALALMQHGDESDHNSNKMTAPVKGGKSSHKPAKLLDWFDNPVNLSEDHQPKTNEGVALKNSETSSLPSDDTSSFPSLHAMSISIQQPKPPPGFTASTTQSRGAAAVSAPPGFASQSVSSAPSTPRSSIPCTPPGFSPNFTYIQPIDFRPRNLKLIEDIRQALTTVEEGFANFKVLSGQFRQGLMDADSYYVSCQALMGQVGFNQVFPELLALLPDISKQRELWAAHQAHAGSTAGGSCRLTACQICGQLLLAADVSHHEQEHASSSHFPLLNEVSKSAATSGHGVGPDMQMKETLIKAK